MEENKQPIVKQDLQSNGDVFVHHLFKTIQGEGPFVGQPAVFVRFYGCNLMCPMCDTDYTSKKIPISAEDLAVAILRLLPKNRLVVFSGGEPLRQNIAPLAKILLEKGCLVQVETNGTLYVKDLPYDHPNFVIICSPKAGKINKYLAPHLAAYKYVLDADDKNLIDGLPMKALHHSVKSHVARPPKDYPISRIYIQPIDVEDAAENARHTNAAIDSAQEHGYTLCIQTHKMIGLE
jgi:7-carboxy-7-deazaguanine synthase